MLYPYTKDYIIVPTPVGVNRVIDAYQTYSSHCPHARGGEPHRRAYGLYAGILSPRPWG